MGRYVVDAGVVLRMLADDSEPSADHKLLAPTLIRSQVLERLYQAVRGGELPEDVGRERLARFSQMKIRFLGDAVLRRRAWKVAEDLGWESTSDAEYVALTQLQADALVTLDDDLSRGVAGVVELASLDQLLSG